MAGSIVRISSSALLKGKMFLATLLICELVYDSPVDDITATTSKGKRKRRNRNYQKKRKEEVEEK